MNDEAKFLAWCETIFNEEAGSLSMEAIREDIEGWDSMGSLLLLADLDEMFDIQLGEGGLEALTSLADLAALIQEKGTVKP